VIAPGERKRFEIPIARLFDNTPMKIPVEVVRGNEDGPTLFVSGAIHGDEVIGTEIIKRLLSRKELYRLKGTLISIPIVNPFGYNNNTRYLPDRRDLNRCFPGSQNGSMAARMAHIFLHEIVSKCQYGIDIHSGSSHRINFPQIRLELKNKDEMQLADAFGAPVILNSNLRQGTLRQAAHALGVKMLLFEGGEALRFDDHSVNIALHGILNVMHQIGMLDGEKFTTHQTVVTAKSSHWLRAQTSGSLRIIKKLGTFVQAGDVLGVISDPFGEILSEVKTSKPGIIISNVTMPLINKGNALFHIATLDEMKVIDKNEESKIVLDQDIDIENEDWFRPPI
jgi:predicted deacylase